MHVPALSIITVRQPLAAFTLLAALSCGAFAPAATSAPPIQSGSAGSHAGQGLQSNDDSARAQEQDDQGQQHTRAQRPRVPEELRHPRARRNGNGNGPPAPPRMVSGGIALTGEESLQRLRSLEPIIGEFAIEGSSFRSGRGSSQGDNNSTAVPLAGTWSNTWHLDGQYLHMHFTLDDLGASDYQVMTMLWYDEREGRFEADVYNSNNPQQTFRWGDFDDDDVSHQQEVEAEDDGDAAPTAHSAQPIAHSAAPAPTLTLYSHFPQQEEGEEPQSRVELTIISINEFHYTGYTRDNPDSQEWQKTYELVMKRIKPFEE